MRFRHAGNDLTDILETAPDEEDQVLKMPVVGKLLPMGAKVEKPTFVKGFLFHGLYKPGFRIFDYLHHCPMEMGLKEVRSLGYYAR
jgi:hypothetical protein